MLQSGFPVLKSIQKRSAFFLFLFTVISITTISCFSRKASTGNDSTDHSSANSKLPTVITGANYISGAIAIYADGEVKSDGGKPVTRRGLCWSEKAEPSIADDTTINGNGTGFFKSNPTHLTPNTQYYVRAFATNSKGTSYGEVVKMSTIPKGNITYTLIKSASPTNEEQLAYDRITKAMDSALYYYNNYTSIVKKLTIYYNPGVPTADGNFNGSIRFGAKPAYSQTGTAMHEIAHVMGVGQHSVWRNDLIKNGIYQGANATNALRRMTGDSTANVKGDKMHFWPFGINGYWEDTGKEDLYITHALIVAGMKKDGLPSN